LQDFYLLLLFAPGAGSTTSVFTDRARTSFKNNTSLPCCLLVAGTNAGTTSTAGQMGGGVVCGVPGYASFPDDTTAAARTAGTAQARITAERRVERIRSQMGRLGPKVKEALKEAKQRLTRAPRR
jgi:hypothetical protein